MSHWLFEIHHFYFITFGILRARRRVQKTKYFILTKEKKEEKLFILPDVVSCVPFFELEIHKTPSTIIGCVEVVSLNLIKDLFGTKSPESNKYIHLAFVFNHSQREMNSMEKIFRYIVMCYPFKVRLKLFSDLKRILNLKDERLLQG